jgi:uncharacterized protein DUF3365|tara:strand:- start:50128 stop:50769 length:642 start_codon:yes stop_codon:yes gene_type:complete
MNKLSYLVYTTAITALLACGNEKTAEQQKVATMEDQPKQIAEGVEELTIEESQAYTLKGQEIAQQTFKALSGSLKKAMSDGGVTNAVKFCNVNESIIVDSLEKHYDVSIKRTSHKLRNEKNKPNASEQEMIDYYLNTSKITEDLFPEVKRNTDNTVSFYSPIHLQPLCVTCHGTVGKTVSESDYKSILALYPNDKAVDFDIDEFRGIWSITFK